MEEELTVVTKRESVLAGEAAGDLMDEDLAEDEVDGSGRLEVADGIQDVGGEKIAVGDAAEFTAEMVMAQRNVTWIGLCGAAFAVGAKVSTTAVGDGNGLLLVCDWAVDRH